MEIPTEPRGTPPKIPDQPAPIEVLQDFMNRIEATDTFITKGLTGSQGEHFFAKLIIYAGLSNEHPDVLSTESYNVFGKELIRRAEILAEGEENNHAQYTTEFFKKAMECTKETEVMTFFTRSCSELTKEDYFNFRFNCGKIAILLSNDLVLGKRIINTAIDELEDMVPKQFDLFFKRSFLDKISPNPFILDYVCPDIINRLVKKECISQESLISIADFIADCCKANANGVDKNSFVINKFVSAFEPCEFSRNFAGNILIPRLEKIECNKNNNYCVALCKLLQDALVPVESQTKILNIILNLVKEEEAKGVIKPGVENIVALNSFTCFENIEKLKEYIRRETILNVMESICLDITGGALKYLLCCHYKCLDQLMLILGRENEGKQILKKYNILKYILNETILYVKNYEEKFRASGLEDLTTTVFLYGYGSFDKELILRLSLIYRMAHYTIEIGEESEEDELFLYDIWKNCFVDGFCNYERSIVHAWVVSCLKESFSRVDTHNLLKSSLAKICESIKTIPLNLIPDCLGVFKIVFGIENSDLICIDASGIEPELLLSPNTDFKKLKMYDMMWDILGSSQHFVQKYKVMKMLTGLFNGDEARLLGEYTSKLKELCKEESQEEQQALIESLIKFYNEYFVVNRLKVKREYNLFSDNQISIIKHYSSNSGSDKIEIDCTFMNTKANFILKDINPYFTNVYQLQRIVTSELEKLDADTKRKFDTEQLRFKVIPQGTEFSAIDYHEAGFAFLTDKSIEITENAKIEISAIDKTILKQDKKSGHATDNLDALKRSGDEKYGGHKELILQIEEIYKVPRKLAITLGLVSGWNGVDNVNSYLTHKAYYSGNALNIDDKDAIFEDDSDENITRIIKENDELSRLSEPKRANTHTTKASQFFRKRKQIVVIEDEQTLKLKLEAFNDVDHDAKCMQMTETLIELLDSSYTNVCNAAWQALRYAHIPKSLIESITKNEDSFMKWVDDYFSYSFTPFKGLYGLYTLKYLMNTDFSGNMGEVFKKYNIKLAVREFINMIQSIVQSYDTETMCSEEAMQNSLSDSFGGFAEIETESDREQPIISCVRVLSTALCMGYDTEVSLGVVREIFVFITSQNGIIESTNKKCFGILTMLSAVRSCDKIRTLEDARAIASDTEFMKFGLKYPETGILCSKLIENVCSAVASLENCSIETKVELLNSVVSEMLRWMNDLSTQNFYDSLVTSLNILMSLVPEAEKAKYSHYPEAIVNAAIAIVDGTDANTSIEHIVGIFKLFEATMNHYGNLLISTQKTQELLKNFAVAAYKKYISLEGAPELRNAAMTLVSIIISGSTETAIEVFKSALPDVINGIKGSVFVANKNYWNYYPGYKEPIMKSNEEDDDDGKNSIDKYTGLNNTGNTCYMNSVLQQMFHIAPLRKAIINIDLSEVSSDDLTFVEKLKTLFKKMCKSKSSNKPEILREFAQSIDSSDFVAHNQQDADEFFGLIYNKLDDALKDTIHWKEISHIFSGKITDILTDTKGVVTKVPDGFRNIRLSVAKNVCAGLDELTKSEELETKVVKRTTFTKLPPVLTIQLNRFVCSQATKNYSKNNASVELSETLDMTKYVLESELSSIDPALAKAYSQYRLRGVILHQGEQATSGHYFSYIKVDKIAEKSANDMEIESDLSTFNEREKVWMCFNDFDVSTLTNDEMGYLLKEGCTRDYGKPSSYILFYERDLVPSADEVILHYCGDGLQRKEDKSTEQIIDMNEDENRRICDIMFSEEYLQFVFRLFTAVSPLINADIDVKNVFLAYFMNIVIRSNLDNLIEGWTDLIMNHILTDKCDAERLINYAMEKDLTISIFDPKTQIKSATKFEMSLLRAIDLLIQDEVEALKNIDIANEQPLLAKFFESIINGIKHVNIHNSLLIFSNLFYY